MIRVRREVGRLWRRFMTPRQPLILLYHRVSEYESDPQLLCVSPDRFRKQLELLLRHYDLVPLESTIEPRNGRRPPLALTFDDGYADNLHVAEPILRRLGVPATLFVTTGLVGSRREFWSLQLEQILLLPGRLPHQLEISVGDEQFTAVLGASATYAASDFEKHRHWSVESPVDPTERHTLYRELCRRLRTLDTDQRNRVLEALWIRAEKDPAAREANRFLTAQEVAALSHGGILSIGGHGVSHTSLSALPAGAQAEEVNGCKRDLESITSSTVRHFAYPFGGHADFTRETVDLVRAAGFAAGAANIPGVIGPNTDRFELRRVLVRDWHPMMLDDHLLRVSGATAS